MIKYSKLKIVDIFIHGLLYAYNNSNPRRINFYNIDGLYVFKIHKDDEESREYLSYLIPYDEFKYGSKVPFYAIRFNLNEETDHILFKYRDAIDKFVEQLRILDEVTLVNFDGGSFEAPIKLVLN